MHAVDISVAVQISSNMEKSTDYTFKEGLKALVILPLYLLRASFGPMPLGHREDHQYQGKQKNMSEFERKVYGLENNL